MRIQDVQALAARCGAAALFMVALLATAPYAAAQQETIVTEAGWNQYLASEVVGLPVRDEDDDEIGEVADLVTRNGRDVTGVVVRLNGSAGAEEREVLVSYVSVLIGASNRTYDGRGAAQAGAARDPESFGARGQDEDAFADELETCGRIRPTHLLLPRLSAEELSLAPAWPMGAWDGPATSGEDDIRIAPGNRQITFSAIRGLTAFDERGGRVGVADDLLIDRAGDVDALVIESSADLRPIAVSIDAVEYEQTRRISGGTLTRPQEITIMEMSSAEINRSPPFRID